MTPSVRQIVLFGRSYSVEAQALFARMTTPPTKSRKIVIDTLIKALKTAGIWPKLDLFYVMAAADAQAASLNWVSSSFTLNPVNSPTFTADRGYAGNGSTSYLDTAWTAGTHAINFLQDSAAFGVWSRTSAQSTGNLMGTRTATSCSLNTRTTTDAASYRVNQSTVTSPPSTDGSGFFSLVRTGASATQSYRNGAAFGSAGAVASSALNNTSAFAVGEGNSTFSPNQAAAAYTGSGAIDQVALYSALLAYMTTVGA